MNNQENQENDNNIDFLGIFLFNKIKNKQYQWELKH